MAERRRFPRRCATGLLVTAQQLVIATVARGLRGTRVLQERTEPLDDADPGARVAELLAEGALPGRVVCGVDPRRVFSLTRRTPKPVSRRDRLDVARRLLPPRLGALRGGVLCDAAPLKAVTPPHALVAACPQPLAEGLYDAFAAAGRHSARLAPVTLAFAEHALRGTRAARNGLRLVYVPGTPDGLALVRSGRTTVAWRLVDTADAPQSALIALRSLLEHLREDLELGSPRELVACTGDDDRALVESLAAELDLPLRVAPARTAEPQALARALAEAGLRPEWPALDMFGALRPRTDLASHFPRPTAVGLGAVLVAAGVWVHLETSRVERQARALEARARVLAADLDLTPAELPDAVEDLELAMGSAQAFLEDRVFWDRPLRSLPGLVPASMRLVSIEARDPMVDPLDGAPTGSRRRQLVLTGEAAIAAADHAPPAALELTDALRDDPVIAESLGRVTGANIQLASTPEGPLARIQVACFDQRGAP